MITIRLARPDEAEALSALKLRSKGHWPYSEAQMAAFARVMVLTPEMLNMPGCEAYVVEVDHMLAGYGCLALLEDGLYIDDLFIDPPFIGRGCGRALAQHLHARAVARGSAQLYVVADPNAVDFYARMGFVSDGEVESDAIGGRMLPRMRLDLA